MSSLPLLINDDPRRLIQLNMKGSVGLGGKNNRDDVVLVQSLLNLVSWQEGGPQKKLATDGISGPLTAAAITRYQRARNLIADGRIDVCGPTIRVLGPSLHSRGLLPLSLKGVEKPSDEFVRALNPNYRPMVRSKAENQPLAAFASKAKSSATTSQQSSLVSPQAYVGSTGWDFVTSSGADLSGWILSVGIVHIYMKHDLSWQYSGVRLAHSFPLLDT
jgi:hypothetical protein